jgi:hypothetical protein
MSTDAERQLAAFIDKFTPDIAARGAATVNRLRARLPNAHVLV